MGWDVEYSLELQSKVFYECTIILHINHDKSERFVSPPLKTSDHAEEVASRLALEWLTKYNYIHDNWKLRPTPGGEQISTISSLFYKRIKYKPRNIQSKVALFEHTLYLSKCNYPNCNPEKCLFLDIPFENTENKLLTLYCRTQLPNIAIPIYYHGTICTMHVIPNTEQQILPAHQVQGLWKWYQETMRFFFGVDLCNDSISVLPSPCSIPSDGVVSSHSQVSSSDQSTLMEHVVQMTNGGSKFYLPINITGLTESRSQQFSHNTNSPMVQLVELELLNVFSESSKLLTKQEPVPVNILRGFSLDRFTTVGLMLFPSFFRKLNDAMLLKHDIRQVRILSPYLSSERLIHAFLSPRICEFNNLAYIGRAVLKFLIVFEGTISSLTPRELIHRCHVFIRTKWLCDCCRQFDFFKCILTKNSKQPFCDISNSAQFNQRIEYTEMLNVIHSLFGLIFLDYGLDDCYSFCCSLGIFQRDDLWRKCDNLRFGHAQEHWDIDISEIETVFDCNLEYFRSNPSILNRVSLTFLGESLLKLLFFVYISSPTSEGDYVREKRRFFDTKALSLFSESKENVKIFKMMSAVVFMDELFGRLDLDSTSIFDDTLESCECVANVWRSNCMEKDTTVRG